jgi:hypothetical protein
MYNFSNAFHVENDYNTYIFGIFMLVYLDSNSLALGKEKLESTGHQFFIGLYKVYDFNLCNGITKIIWRKKMDRHRTKPSINNDGFIGIGTSTQISTSLIQAVVKVRFYMILKLKY